MAGITNMAGALLDNPSRGGTPRWGVSSHLSRCSFGYLSPEAPLTRRLGTLVRWDSMCVRVCVHVYKNAHAACHSCVRRRLGGIGWLLLRSVLINPMTTEWIRQGDAFLGIGVRRWSGEGTYQLGQCQTLRMLCSRSSQDTLFAGSHANSAFVYRHRLLPDREIISEGKIKFSFS